MTTKKMTAEERYNMRLHYCGPQDIQFVKRIQLPVLIHLRFRLPTIMMPKFQKHFSELMKKWSRLSSLSVARIVNLTRLSGSESTQTLIEVVIPNKRKRELVYLLGHLGGPFSDELTPKKSLTPVLTIRKPN